MDKRSKCVKLSFVRRFASPHLLSQKQCQIETIWAYKANKDPRGFNAPPNKTPAEMIEDVREHIKSFPTMTSHYVRKSVKREYLDCKLSVPKMYKLYLEQCNEREKKPCIREYIPQNF